MRTKQESLIIVIAAMYIVLVFTLVAGANRQYRNQLEVRSTAQQVQCLTTKPRL